MESGTPPSVFLSYSSSASDPVIPYMPSSWRMVCFSKQAEEVPVPVHCGHSHELLPLRGVLVKEPCLPSLHQLHESPAQAWPWAAVHVYYQRSMLGMQKMGDTTREGAW